MSTRICVLLTATILLIGSAAMATTLTITFMPESSQPYPYPPSMYGSNSDNPIGPFSGLAVAYKGMGVPGGSQEQLSSDAWLVYRFQLAFSDPVIINSVTMHGWGDQQPSSVMRLLDSTKTTVLSSAPISVDPWGNNQLGTWVLNGLGATGTAFYYDEFDRSGVVRYRDSIVVSYSAVPEPASLLLLGTGLGVIGVAAWRRKK